MSLPEMVLKAFKSSPKSELVFKELTRHAQNSRQIEFIDSVYSFYKRGTMTQKQLQAILSMSYRLKLVDHEMILEDLE